MGRLEPGRSRVTIDIDRQLAIWADQYAKERGLGREHIYETALMQMRERVEAQ